MNKGTKLIALALALVVVVGAIGIMVAKWPVAGADDTNNDDTGPTDNNNTDPTENDDPQDDTEVGPKVTTIAVTKTAEGFWERTITYYWTVEKELNATTEGATMGQDGWDIMILTGESAMISYDLFANRSEPSLIDVYGVRGMITVTNTGCNDTENLTITDTVLTRSCDGEWTEYVSFQVDVSCHPVLAPGESYDYEYEVIFSPLSSVDYCNVADANITNLADNYGECAGVSASAAFELPSEPEVTEIDEEATLEDVLTVPCGFEVVSSSGFGPWDLSGNETGRYMFTVTVCLMNVDAGDCGASLQNSALLVPSDTGVPQVDWYYLTINGGAV